MSNQLQITGGAKVRNLQGVITGTSGVLGALGINVPDGIPQLDGSGKILVSQLPNSVMEYKGTWNVATNTPYLVDGVGNAGDVYIVTGAATGGTTHNFGAGPILFYNGDQAIYDGSLWQRASGSTGTVTSVAMTTPSGLSVSGSPITTSGTLALSLSSGYIIPTTSFLNGLVPYTGATQTLDMGAFDVNARGIKINGTGGLGHADFKHQSGTPTGSASSSTLYADTNGNIAWLNDHSYTMTIAANANTADRTYTFPNTSGTIALTSDISYPVTSVFGRTGAVTAQSGDYTTTLVTEGTNLYYTDARARGALSFTAGSGAYNSTTGVITIPTNTNQLTNGASFITLTSLSAGTGISYNNTTGVISSTITQYTDAMARAAISLTTTGTSGVATYNSTTGVLNVPNYSETTFGTVTSVALAAPTGFSVTGTPVTSSGTLTLGFATGYSLPTNASQANWDTAYTNRITSATSPLSISSNTISITIASSTSSGYLSQTDYNVFNGKQNAITLTTTGSSGAATFSSNTLNIPNYTLSGLGGVPTSRTLTINGTAYDLSADRTWSVGTLTGGGADGRVAFWNGASNVVSDSLFVWDDTNNRLGIGLVNPQRALEVYSATADSHVRLSGAAPSVSMGEAITGSIYQAKFGLATASGQFVTGSVAGDFVISNQTGSTIWAYNSSEKMRLNTSGRLLIGTTSDNTALLQVAGAATFSSSITAATLSTIGTAVAGQNVQLNLNGVSGKAQRIEFQNSGVQQWLLGAGAASETSAFEIFNSTGVIALSINKSTNAATFSSSVTANILNSTSAGSTQIFLKSTGGGSNRDWQIQTNETAAGDISFMQSTTAGGSTYATKLNINPSGNVGIGTSSPVSVFQVVGAGQGVGGFSGATYGIRIDAGGQFSSGMSTIHGVDTSLYGSYQPIMINGSDVRFGTSATERMRITSGGYVGIGTSSPEGPLQIYGTNGGGYVGMVIQNAGGTTNTSCGIDFGVDASGTYNGGGNAQIKVINTNSSDNRSDMTFSTWSGASFGERMRITSGGYVLVGYTSNPSAAGLLQTTSAYVGSLGTGIVYSLSGVLTSTNPSDLRLKDNVEDLGYGLKEILQLRPVKYNWKNDNANQGKQFGFIAQEVQEVMPELVTTFDTEDGERLGLEKEGIYAALVQAIKEQQAQIEELKALINK